jgi:hypothetical protein
MKETIDFTPREKWLINYYRDRPASGGGRGLAGQIFFTVAPLISAALYFWRGEPAWIFVGYALLLYRAAQTLGSAILYTSSFANIFEKYEAKLQELEAAQKPAN